MQQQPKQKSDASVLLVDAKALRRAELTAFLSDWAADNHVSIVAVTPDDMEGVVQPDAAFALSILNLGAGSLKATAGAEWLQLLLKALPATPVAIISDLDAVDEVVAAVRVGARGFLPTSTDPAIALRTLSFIMQGGSFFPPTALLEDKPATPRPAGIIDFGPRNMEASQHLFPLTPRQHAVLRHLQAGLSNKEIGNLLGVRESTVKDDVRHIMRKLGASNRTQAALAADQDRLPGKPAGRNGPL